MCRTSTHVNMGGMVEADGMGSNCEEVPQVLYIAGLHANHCWL
jgi:hypothetical protein